MQYKFSTFENKHMLVQIYKWIRVLLEKVRIAQLVKKFSSVYETKCSLEAATGPYPEPYESCPHHSKQFTQDLFNKCLCVCVCISPRNFLFLSGFPRNI